MTGQTPLVVTADTVHDVARHVPLILRPALKLLAQIRKGTLAITLPDGLVLEVRGTEPGPSGAITLKRWRALRRAALRGDVGLGEAFMDGDWDSPDVAALLYVFAANATDSEGAIQYAPGRLAGLALKVRHLLNRNTRGRAKRNIQAHYDLGNAFYGAWLDPSMTYSSALYDAGANDLESAQADKYRALIARTGITGDHHVLEIGCGWGGFACLAAAETGCRVTGITLSPAQKAYAEARIAKAGLSGKITIELVDYRDVRGSYDRIVSIEMFEAVGEEYWGAYFDQLAALLRPGGAAGLQVITIKDAFFDEYRKGADFLQTYIFPGGLIPAEGKLAELGRAAGLSPGSLRSMGLDYARTLAEWRERFGAAWGAISAQGFNERFRRMWIFYLAMCEAGFRSGLIDVKQVAYTRP